jgi:hypothetical protein
VDVVELFSERPLVFCVVNLEAAVWGDAVRTSVRWWEVGTLKIKGKHSIRVGLDSDLYQEPERRGTDLLDGVIQVSDEVLIANRIQLPKYQSLFED